MCCQPHVGSVCHEYQRAFSLKNLWIKQFSFILFRLFLSQIMSSVRRHKHPFIQANMLIDLWALAHRSAFAGSHKNIQITYSLFRGRGLLNMILFYFMVKIRTFFQLHEYKYNIKFCRRTIFKSVGELSSILSVNCLPKPCRWTVLSVNCLDSVYVDDIY